MTAKPTPPPMVPPPDGKLLLQGVARPADVARMNPEELAALAVELRRVIIEPCSEGGGHLATSLHAQGLLDELRLFQAMKVLGDEDGHAAFAGRTVTTMDEAWNFRLVEHRIIGADLYLRLRPKE